jgi:hypothetical protein
VAIGVVQVTSMVATGPRLPKPIGGDTGGDEPLRISLGEGMMGACTAACRAVCGQPGMQQGLAEALQLAGRAHVWARQQISAWRSAAQPDRYRWPDIFGVGHNIPPHSLLNGLSWAQEAGCGAVSVVHLPGCEAQ